MDIDVIEETENPMLHRTDVRFEVTHEEATPSRLSVRDSLAAMLNKDAEEVVVQKLDTKFGMRTTVGSATVYETPEHALEVEQDYMLLRNKIESDGSGIQAVPDEANGDEAAADDDDETADDGAEDEAAESPDDADDEGEADEAPDDDTDEAAADDDTADGDGDAEEDEGDDEAEAA